MEGMEEEDVLAYVRTTARMLDLPLDEAHARAVAGHLGRTVALARLLEAVPLSPEEEVAEI
ncbi:DUF4089 domain-containing protein, partial [Leptospira sp. SA-E8]|uniref:DUF4089 domain-containing protein n=1 Tax=Leptospira sp. SA-E8 TaxID=3422259 RepID=UPI003EBF8B89